MLGYVVHLPHVISSESISQQMQIPEGIILPTKVDENSELLIHHASFSDMGLPVLVRVKERINLLLRETALQNAFQRMPQKSPLLCYFSSARIYLYHPKNFVQYSYWFKTALVTLSVLLLSAEKDYRRLMRGLIGPDAMQTLLVITLNLTEKIIDGTGEAAAALLMSSPERPEVNRNVVAQVHRPEQMKTTRI
jgi:hypothetical protein